MREPLVLQLEKFSYYQHLSLSGGKERPIFACRTVDIRGAQFHVLSRIADSGLDFTGRTNFIAHHLVFTPEETRQFPTPPVILRDWLGWVKGWTKEPELLENESWSGLEALNGQANVPARAWHRLTGEAANAYGLLEARSGASFRVDDVPDEVVLELFAESLELLEVRDPRRDFRSVAWNYRFTTSMQEQDNPADFRWRCIHADNPAAARFAGPDCRDLTAVRPMKTPTAEEASFAREGRQAPRFTVQPQSFDLKEGEAAKFTAKAEGVPSPAYQWFSVDRNNQPTLLTGETRPELVVANPALGVSRYLVAATNVRGTEQSVLATLQVQRKVRVAPRVRVDDSEPGLRKGALHIRTEEEIEAQRTKIQMDQEAEEAQRRGKWKRILAPILVAVVCLALVATVVGVKLFRGKQQAGLNGNPDGATNLMAVPAVPAASNSMPQVSSTQVPSATNGPVPNARPALAMPKYETAVPSGWIEAKIGNVGNQHDEYVSSNFNLTAAAEGIGTNNDNISFVYRTNFTEGLQAVFEPKDGNSEKSCCGIMIRESEKPNSAFVFIGVSSERVFMSCRETNGQTALTEYKLPTLKSKAIILRVVREANCFVPGYLSSSSGWTEGTNFLSLQDPVLAGFVVASGSISNTVTAQFKNLARPQETQN